MTINIQYNFDQLYSPHSHNNTQRSTLLQPQKKTPARTIFYYVLLITLSVGPSSPIAADTPTNIYYAYPDQMVIVSRIDENGKFDNPLNKLLDQLFKRAGVNWESKEFPATRMFQTLDKGTANFSILVNSPELSECCLISTTPILSTELRVYHKKGLKALTNIQALRDKNIITLRGYSYGPFKTFIDDPKNRIKVLPTGTHTSAFEMLREERANYLLDYNYPSVVVLKNNPITDIQFEPLTKIDLHLVLHKSYPNAKRFMEQLESIIEDLDVEGILSLPSRAPYE